MDSGVGQGGVEPFVTEELLDTGNAATRIEQLGGAGVPQAVWIDGPEQTWNKSGDDVAPVMKEIKTMHAKGHGVIGMKLVGDGDFKNPEDREKAMRFAMAQPEIDCVVIGFKSTDEIDEAIQRMNRALAEG